MTSSHNYNSDSLKGIDWIADIHKVASMKTTIDIPNQALEDAMRFTGAKTKRDAVVFAIEDYNRRQRVADAVKMFGTFTSIMTNDEIETLEQDKQSLQ